MKLRQLVLVAAATLLPAIPLTLPLSEAAQEKPPEMEIVLRTSFALDGRGHTLKDPTSVIEESKIVAIEMAGACWETADELSGGGEDLHRLASYFCSAERA